MKTKQKAKRLPLESLYSIGDLNGVSCKHPWLYRGAVGMLSYLSNSVCPEIQMAVHQTARFSVNPMQSHELAIMRIGWYLVDNPDCGIQYKIHKSKDSKSTLTQILLAAGVQQIWRMQTISYQELVLLSVMPPVQSYGAASFRLKFLFLQQKRSILPCLMLFVRQYQFRIS
jgi:hypothetical protein